MSPHELGAEIEKVDAELARKNAPLLGRPFDAYRRLVRQFGTSEQCFEPFGTELLQEILDWYGHRYGHKMNPELKLGEKPILIRGALYFLRFPIVLGQLQIDIFQHIQGITDELLGSLSQDEQDAIASAFAKGYEEIAELEGMSLSSAKVPQEIREIISRGLEDITASIAVLKASDDAQGTIFLAHRAAEKFMKAALALLTNDTLKNVKKSFGKYGHDLQEGLQALGKVDTRFSTSTISAHIGNLHLPDMKIGYEEQSHTAPDAVRAIDATCAVCTFIAIAVFYWPADSTD